MQQDSFSAVVFLQSVSTESSSLFFRSGNERVDFVTGAAVAGVARRSSSHLAERTEYEGGSHVGHKTVS